MLTNVEGTFFPEFLYGHCNLKNSQYEFRKFDIAFILSFPRVIAFGIEIPRMIAFGVEI